MHKEAQNVPKNMDTSHKKDIVLENRAATQVCPLHTSTTCVYSVTNNCLALAKFEWSWTVHSTPP